jgi:hypothetical protein
VAKIAFCQECGRYVELGDAGVCAAGHPRSALRDVRSGTLRDAPGAAARGADAPGAAARGAKAARQTYGDEIGIGARLLGWGIVVVPVGLLLAFALWTGYEQFSGGGVSPFMRVVYSVGSLALTGGIVWIMVLRKRHRG